MDSTIWQAGELLGDELKLALSERQQRQAREQSDRYATIAAEYMVERGIISQPDCDRRDVECRCCGWNPDDVAIHNWFWPLSQESRSELVRLSRKISVRFWRNPGDECETDE